MSYGIAPDDSPLGVVFWMTVFAGAYLGVLAWHTKSTWEKKGPNAACASGVVGLLLLAVTALCVSGNARLTMQIGLLLLGPAIIAVGIHLRRKAAKLR